MILLLLVYQDSVILLLARGSGADSVEVHDSKDIHHLMLMQEYFRLFAFQGEQTSQLTELDSASLGLGTWRLILSVQLEAHVLHKTRGSFLHPCAQLNGFLTGKDMRKLAVLFMMDFSDRNR